MDIYMLQQQYKGHMFFHYVPRHLYRNHPPGESFEKAFDPRIQIGPQSKKGRGTDIVVLQGHDRMQWVVAGTGGVSLFDGPSGLPGEDLALPAGTLLPFGLVLKRDAFNKDRNAFHYGIHPISHQHRKVFVHLLERLARSLVTLEELKKLCNFQLPRSPPKK